LNRSNVAFSRAKDRLIVICSETLLDHIPSDLDQYQSTLLWKSLRELCSTLLGSTSINGHVVSLYTPPFEPNAED
jgi:superfamily I DNA and/or RNA helicase